MPEFKAQRLQNLQIEYPQFNTVVDVLSHLGAIQGQDFPGAKWSLGLRLPNSTHTDIEQAITDKQIVRTWLMRGTLFMTTAVDVRWMLRVIAPRVIDQSQRRYRELELDSDTLNRSSDILLKALDGGKQLGRRALYSILEDHGISTTGQRGAHIVRHTSLQGLIVQGTVNKNDPVFMCLDAALPDGKRLSRDVALAELAQRYFTSHGYATLYDFAWWTGLLMADVRAGFEAIRPQLEEEVIDGESYYRSIHSVVQSSPPSPGIYAPPGFDEYLLGYKDRDRVLDPEHATRVCPGGNGVFFPTIIIDGHIRGIWKRTIKKKIMQVQAMPFSALTKPEQTAFTQAIQQFGTFWDCEVTVEFENPPT